MTNQPNLFLRGLACVLVTIFACLGVVALAFGSVSYFDLGYPYLQAVFIFAIAPFFLSFPIFEWLFMTFRPARGVAQASLADVKRKIISTFSLASPDANAFLIKDQGNALYLTWSGRIDRNLFIEVGSFERKTVYAIIFNERNHEVRLKTTIVDKDWDIGALGVSGSLSFKSGWTLSYDSQFAPSFTVAPDGAVSIDIKQLSYGTMSVLGPLLAVLNTAGWTVKFRAFKHPTFFVAGAVFFALIGSVLAFGGIPADKAGSGLFWGFILIILGWKYVLPVALGLFVICMIARKILKSRQ